MKHYYAYYRGGIVSAWILIGMYASELEAKNATRDSVKGLGLRCLFHWDDDGNYRCGADERNIHGTVRTERIESEPKQQEEKKMIYKILDAGFPMAVVENEDGKSIAAYTPGMLIDALRQRATSADNDGTAMMLEAAAEMLEKVVKKHYGSDSANPEVQI